MGEKVWSLIDSSVLKNIISEHENRKLPGRAHWKFAPKKSLDLAKGHSLHFRSNYGLLETRDCVEDKFKEGQGLRKSFLAGSKHHLKPGSGSKRWSKLMRGYNKRILARAFKTDESNMRVKMTYVNVIFHAWHNGKELSVLFSLSRT